MKLLHNDIVQVCHLCWCRNSRVQIKGRKWLRKWGQNCSMVLKEGLNGRNTEEVEIRQPEDSALKILPQLWLVSSILGAKGKRQRSLNDILQRSHTLHTLLNSPLVSGIKTIFTEGVIQCQLYRIIIRSRSCKWQVMFGTLFCAYLLCNILQCCHMWFAVFNSYSFSVLHSPDHNCVFFFPYFYHASLFCCDLLSTRPIFALSDKFI